MCFLALGPLGTRGCSGKALGVSGKLWGAPTDRPFARPTGGERRNLYLKIASFRFTAFAAPLQCLLCLAFADCCESFGVFSTLPAGAAAPPFAIGTTFFFIFLFFLLFVFFCLFTTLVGFVSLPAVFSLRMFAFCVAMSSSPVQTPTQHHQHNTGIKTKK